MPSPKAAKWIEAKVSEGFDRDDLSKMRDVYLEESGSSMSHESWRRVLRDVFGNGLQEQVEDLPSILRKIGERYTPEDLRKIARGTSMDAELFGSPRIVTREGDTFEFGVITDTHIGSKYFHPGRLMEAFDTFRNEGIETILHVGDVTEGMSSREGHVFECSEIGFDNQRDRAVELLGQWEGDIYAIDGNHDRWFGKRSGSNMVGDIAKLLPNFYFLGHDEGDLFLKTENGRCWIKLWHGEDGSSYAISYRLQKLVESLTGGQKPHILLTGHVHKAIYLMERNIHCLGGGCLQNQTKWMRGKRLAAHTGYWIIRFTFTEDGVTRFTPTWYPFFE